MSTNGSATTETTVGLPAGSGVSKTATAATAAAKRKGTVTKDPELVAMNRIVAVLSGLSTDDERRNVLAFITRKYGAQALL